MAENNLQKRNAPSSCNTREDVRHEIDRLDSALMMLLAERWQYVHRMSELKSDVSEANVPSRVEQVISNVTEKADEACFPAELAEDLWRTMINFAIKYEEEQIRARGDQS